LTPESHLYDMPTIQTREFAAIGRRMLDDFAPFEKVAASGLSGNDLICFLQGLRTPLRHLLDLAQLFQGLFLLKQTASLRGAVLRQLITLLEYETRMRLQKSGHVVNLTTSLVSEPTKEGKNQSINHEQIIAHYCFNIPDDRKV
jgi:hypothetical protein